MPAVIKKIWFVALVAIFAPIVLQGQSISTVAGTAGVMGSMNGNGTSATFNNPYGIAADRFGNFYVANRFGNTIRKIDPFGNVTTFAGTGTPGATDGPGATATFNEPWGIACDTLGNVYVADTRNYKIRKIDALGNVSTLAGMGVFGVTNGINQIAQFGFPSGIAVNKNGTIVYVSDRMTNTIRKIENGSVTTFAGTVYTPGSTDGQGLSAKFDHPNGLAIDDAGNILVADEFNNKIRKITPSGLVITLAGSGSAGDNNGAALSATFRNPWGVCQLPNGDLLVGDSNNFTIRKISNGQVSVFAGQSGVAGMNNGPVLSATFNGVSSLCPGANGQILICDPYSHLIRKYAPLTINLNISGGATTFCQGTSISISASPSGLTNYKLFADGVLVASSANGTFSLNALSIGTHTITSTATGTNGTTIFSDPKQITITSGLQVTIQVSGSATFCDGDSVTLSTSASGNYLWSNGATTQSIRATVAGYYTVTVTNTQGCSGTSQPQLITTLQPPAATIASMSPGTNCSGTTVVLTAGAAPSYLWSTGDTTQSISVNGAGNYTVLVTNNSGCSAMSLPMNVNYYPQSISTTTPSGNIVIAQGAQLQISANNGSSYQWSNGATTPFISIADSGSYMVTVTDLNGCISVPATVFVSFISASNLVSVSGPTSVCEGDTVSLTSAFPNGNQWYKNNMAIPGATGINYAATQNGVYKLRYAPTGSTPVFSDNITVELYSLPSSLQVNAPAICPFSQASIEILPEPGIFYTWFSDNTGVNQIATGSNYLTPVLTTATSYFIGMTDLHGCKNNTLIEVQAAVNPSPESNFSAGQTTISANGYQVPFQSAQEPGATYYWVFGDGSSSVQSSPEHLFSGTGNYQVTCIATSSEGCTDTTTQEVRVALPDNLFIPNAFTPDGDGQNDVFRVRGNNILYTDISIFDQWAKLIFHGEKLTEGWDGRGFSGSVPTGTYNYSVRIYFDNGVTSSQRGSISLIR